jgi:hypothetical protein
MRPLPRARNPSFKAKINWVSHFAKLNYRYCNIIIGRGEKEKSGAGSLQRDNTYAATYPHICFIALRAQTHSGFFVF